MENKKRKLKAIKMAILFSLPVLLILLVWLQEKLKDDSLKNVPSLASTADITAKAWHILEVKTGTAYGSKGENETVTLASLAKLFIASYAMEYLNVDDTVVVGDEIQSIPEDASIAGLIPGEYTVRDLMEASLIPSGMDGSYALLAAVTRSRTNDPSLSGEEALETGLRQVSEWMVTQGYEDTRIVDAGGYSPENISNLEDIINITVKALQYPDIDAAVRKFTTEIRLPDGKNLTLKNTNSYLDPDTFFYTPHATGVKTGALEDYCNLILRLDVKDKSYLLFLLGAKTEEIRDGEMYWLSDGILDKPTSGDKK